MTTTKKAQAPAKKAPAVRKRAAASDPAPVVATGRIQAGADSVNPRPEFDWSDAIAATQEGNVNKLAATHGGPKGGFNPAQVGRLMAGQVARVDKARAEFLSKALGVAFAQNVGACIRGLRPRGSR